MSETNFRVASSESSTPAASKSRPVDPSAGWAQPSSLYLHVPFCPYKCPYCDFVTHIGSPSLVQPYVDALCREIRQVGAGHPNHPLQTVFLGGGTPGMLAADQIAQLLAIAGQAFGIKSGAEITIETNPDTVSVDVLAGFVAAGVNRLSIGVQSLIAEELRLLGRGHSPEMVGSAVRSARRAGFTNLSLDLIYGVRRQTVASWRKTLEAAVALEPEHVSLYSLIIEPGTVYNRLQKRGELTLPEADRVADMYDIACEILNAAGFIHYEVANWGQPGMESRHNTVYWRDEQFFAAGVGAFDYLRPYRSVRIRDVKKYVDRITAAESVIDHRDEVTPPIERFETVVMGLRLLEEGVSRDRFQDRFPQGLDAVYGEQLEFLSSHDLIEDDGITIRLPERRVPIANEIWERFLP